jgi:hypothetical protein
MAGSANCIGEIAQGESCSHDFSRAGIYGVQIINKPGRSKAMSLIDAIDNLYEKLVADAIDETRDPEDNEDFLADVICVALNRLPSKYYRHSVDMVFYMAEGEMDAMKKDSLGAVRDAREFVRSHKRDL